MLTAIERMRQHFPMPRVPMGEAWFMDKTRTLYYELMKQPIAEIETCFLSRILWEIASGTKSFGHFEEWERWFRFLLPHLILRSHETHAFEALFEHTVNSFYNIFDQGITEEYQGFREDVILSLSLSLMKNELWIDWIDEVTKQRNRRPLFLIEDECHLRIPYDWSCRQSNSQFSAAMFFCLRYLKPIEIKSWVKSLVSISDPFWRGHLLVWLVGLGDLCKEQIITPARIERAVPKIDWHDSFLVNLESGYRSWIPRENIASFMSEIRQEISSDVLLQWVDVFAEYPELKDALWDIPDLYFDKFCNVA